MEALGKNCLTEVFSGQKSVEAERFREQTIDVTMCRAHLLSMRGSTIVQACMFICLVCPSALPMISKASVSPPLLLTSISPSS